MISEPESRFDPGHAPRENEVQSLRDQLNQRTQELARLQQELEGLQLRFSGRRYRLADRAANWLGRRPVAKRLVLATGRRLYRVYRRVRRIGSPQTPALEVPPDSDANLVGNLSAAQSNHLLSKLCRKPLVSIVVPVYRPEVSWLERCIESVHRQHYPRWQLVLVDDCSQDPKVTQCLQGWASRDERIVWDALDSNGGICAASNRGVELATGEFIGFLDHDDELTPDALTWIVLEHNRRPEAQWFYSDEDIVAPDGRTALRAFKPDFSPEYLLSAMFTCHFSVYAADLLRRAGGFRLGFEGSQDHDLALRLSELVSREDVVHIPRILYHWWQVPGSTSAGDGAKPYAAVAGRRAVSEALARRGLEGEVTSYPLLPTLYQPALKPQSFPKVSVLIPTRNGLDLLQKCLEALRRNTSYPNYEVVVIDNQSDDPELLDFLKREEEAKRLRVFHYPKPFNHSVMHNEVVKGCDSEYLVFLNNDVEIVSGQWLEQFVATAQMDASIAGVGALLVYPDGTIQHAGVVLGLYGVAGHSHKRLPAETVWYCGRAQALQEVSAATAALLLMRRSAFESIGGFDAKHFPTSYNDVDLWLRLRSAGFRCVYNPLIRAIHYESKTRGFDFDGDAPFRQRLVEKWHRQLARDPFYNPNLSLDNEQFLGYRPYPFDIAELESSTSTRPDDSVGPAIVENNDSSLRDAPANTGAKRRKLEILAPEGSSRRRILQLTRRGLTSARTHGWRKTARRARARIRESLKRRLGRQESAPGLSADLIKKTVTHLARIQLDAFLASGATLEFATSEFPRVSILLVLHNRAELTLACLNSIRACAGVSYEIVLVDNNSTDQTAELLSRLRGVRIVANAENRGFAAAVNQASREAAGDYLLLLNNDAQLLGNSLSVAERVFLSHPDVGAVGGKILLLDGILQESGSIVFSDGSALGCGRGQAPYLPKWMYVRDVDFCSGAFLMVPRGLFLEMGGLDEAFNPAYYEDVDFCIRLHQAGLRVVCHPDVVLLHYESASSTGGSARGLMLEKQAVLVQKHGHWLKHQPARSAVRPLEYRPRPGTGRRILYLDDRAPHGWLGTGYPRANHLVKELVEQGHVVTLYPLVVPNEDWASIYSDLPRELEVMINRGVPGLQGFLRERIGDYDLVLISRPHNMRVFRDTVRREPQLIEGMKIVYDAEALFCLREATELKLGGNPISAEESRKQMQEELQLADGCVSVISVSDAEARHYRKYGHPRVHVLSHALDVVPGDRPFPHRKGLLFVGPVHDPDSPNGDAVRWLFREFLPRWRAQYGDDSPLTLAGPWCSGVLPDHTDCGGARILGKMQDLAPVYNESRIFVVPTRFAGGIPLKVCEAAAHGIPVVATSLIADQLQWRHERELLVADSPEEFLEQCARLYEDRDLWERLRATALSAIEREFSRELFSQSLRRILDEALSLPESLKEMRASTRRAA